MNTMNNIINIHSSELWSVGPDVPAYEALQLMAKNAIGMVLVFEYGKLIGTISERNYAREVVLQGGQSSNASVRAMMCTDFPTAGLSTTFEDAMLLFAEHGVHHLPIVESGNCLGVISILEVAAAKGKNKDFLIDQLQRYICGPSPESLSQAELPQIHNEIRALHISAKP